MLQFLSRFSIGAITDMKNSFLAVHGLIAGSATTSISIPSGGFGQESNSLQQAPAAQKEMHPEVQKIFDEGAKHYTDKKYDLALPLFHAALEKARALNDAYGEALCLHQGAMVLAASGRGKEAIPRFLPAIEALKKHERGERLVQSWTFLMYCYADTGDKKSAIATARSAAAYYEQEGYPTKAGRFLAQGSEYLADSVSRLAMLQQAVLRLRRTDARNAPSPVEVAAIQGFISLSESRIAGFLGDIGELTQALELHLKLIDQFRNDPPLLAIECTNLSLLFNILGDDAQQIFYAAKGRDTYVQWFMTSPASLTDGYAYNVALSIINLGVAYAEMERYSDALQEYDRALKFVEKCPPEEQNKLKAIIQFNRGAAWQSQNKLPLARACFTQAKNLSTGEDPMSNYADGALGIVAFGERKYPEAIALFARVIPQLEKQNDQDSKLMLSEVLMTRGLIEEGEKRYAVAARSYDDGIALLEDVRLRIGNYGEARTLFTADVLESYQHWIGLMLKAEGRRAVNLPRVFDAVQKVKGRGLLDLQFSETLRLSRLLNEDERHQREALRATLLQCAEKRDAATSRTERETASQSLITAERERAVFDQKLRTRHYGKNQQPPPEPVHLSEVQRLLPSDTAIVELVSLWSNPTSNPLALDVTHALVITRGAARTIPLNAAAKEVGPWIDRLYEGCRNADNSWREPARKLHQRLIEPLVPALKGIHRLILCPDGPLWKIPFNTLLDAKNSPLLERYEVVHAYSSAFAAATLAAKNRNPHAASAPVVLSVVNPVPGSAPKGVLPKPGRASGGRFVPLPGTEQEAAALQGLHLNGVYLKGAQATRERTLQSLESADLLHFGTHAVFNHSAPMMSGLLVSPDSAGVSAFITANEILEQDLSHCEMAILSACETGRGLLRKGEGPIGLTWAFIGAGCASLLATGWQVGDKSSAALIKEFVTLRYQKKMTRGTALRQAALAIRKSYSHPKQWASFLLFGDWR